MTRSVSTRAMQTLVVALFAAGCGGTTATTTTATPPVSARGTVWLQCATGGCFVSNRF